MTDEGREVIDVSSPSIKTVAKKKMRHCEHKNISSFKSHLHSLLLKLRSLRPPEK